MWFGLGLDLVLMDELQEFKRALCQIEVSFR